MGISSFHIQFLNVNRAHFLSHLPLYISGWTAFHVACYNGHLNVVRFLASINENANKPSPLGYHPIHAASASGHRDVVQFLVEEMHVPVDVVDHTSSSPFDAACQNSHTDVAEYIMIRLAREESYKNTNNRFMPELEEPGNISEVSHTSWETPPVRRRLHRIGSISECSEEVCTPPVKLERECNRLRLANSRHIEDMKSLRTQLRKKDDQINELWTTLSTKQGELQCLKEELKQQRELAETHGTANSILLEKLSSQKQAYDRLFTQSSNLLLTVAIYFPIVIFIIALTLLLDALLVSRDSFCLLIATTTALTSLGTGVFYSGHILSRFRYHVFLVVGVFLILGMLYWVVCCRGK